MPKTETGYMLTIPKAVKYFGIGEHSLRRIIKDNPNADFIVMVGNRHYIKVKLFEAYLDTATVL